MWTSPVLVGSADGSHRLSGTRTHWYGLMKRWLVTNDGAFIDGVPLSSLKLCDLDLAHERLITVRLGVTRHAC